MTARRYFRLYGLGQPTWVVRFTDPQGHARMQFFYADHEPSGYVMEVVPGQEISLDGMVIDELELTEVEITEAEWAAEWTGWQ